VPQITRGLDLSDPSAGQLLTVLRDQIRGRGDPARVDDRALAAPARAVVGVVGVEVANGATASSTDHASQHDRDVSRVAVCW
jgi:hypothetical protein